MSKRQIDYDREMAFIATARDVEGAPERLAVVRAATDPDNERAEFGIMVRSDLKGRGLGKMLFLQDNSLLPQAWHCPGERGGPEREPEHAGAGEEGGVRRPADEPSILSVRKVLAQEGPAA